MKLSVKKKLFSLLLTAVAAVICYICLVKGESVMQWAGLAAVAASSILLYVNC